MAITDIPILSMLRTRLSWHQERQRVLAENVANANTTGFRPRDLVQPKFTQTGVAAATPATTIALARTESSHIAGAGLGASSFRSEIKGNYEIRPAGNAVSLEDEMMKVATNQMDYQAATAVYSHSLNLMKIAMGRR
jgi:flagellar basal-body rod protein FlgB